MCHQSWRCHQPSLRVVFSVRRFLTYCPLRCWSLHCVLSSSMGDTVVRLFCQGRCSLHTLVHNCEPQRQCKLSWWKGSLAQQTGTS